MMDNNRSGRLLRNQLVCTGQGHLQGSFGGQQVKHFSMIFEGWDASGKGDSIGALVYPMDPRGFKVHTTQAPSREERLRPFLWRFWNKLPTRGDFCFFDRSWYRCLLEDRLERKVKSKHVPRVADAIREFEQYKKKKPRSQGEARDDTDELITRAKSKKAILEAEAAEKKAASRPAKPAAPPPKAEEKKAAPAKGKEEGKK